MARYIASSDNKNYIRFSSISHLIRNPYEIADNTNATEIRDFIK